MAMKPNYNFEKRQRELAKKKQREEKRLTKRAHSGDGTATSLESDGASVPRNDAGSER